jgi:hypothetical protein
MLMDDYVVFVEDYDSLTIKDKYCFRILLLCILHLSMHTYVLDHIIRLGKGVGRRE